MSRQLLISLIPLVLFSITGLGQDLDRYSWAMGLHEEFGFDDMAEAILKDMASGRLSPPTEKLKGQMGLARLKASLAEKNTQLSEKLRLLGEAEKLMKAAIAAWPDKQEMAYFDAIFQRASVLEARGEAALSAVTAGTVDESDADRYRKEADGDFARAVMLLKKVRNKFEDADADKDISRWRLKMRAWYTLCLLSYNQALTHKATGSTRAQILDSVAESLEEFILENDIDNFEAWVGSLHGTLLKAKTLAAKTGYEDEAEAYFTATFDQVTMVADQNGWTDKPYPPAVQALLERAYWEFFRFSNGRGSYDRTLKYGARMEETFKKTRMHYRKYGRAARVELAKAYFRSGDQNLALAIAAQVTETGKGDASGIFANRLIAEIISVTPDKSQFRPEIIRSAANGAWSQGRAGWEEAEKYFRILLQVTPKISDPKLRLATEAEAWFKIGYVAYDKERWLQAALTFEKGARDCHAVTTDGLGQKLIKYWAGALRKAANETKSPLIGRLDDACSRFRLKYQTTRSQGEKLWDVAVKIERKAKSAKGAAANKLWKDAAAAFKKCSEAGGPKQERAMAKVGRCVLKLAKSTLKTDPSGARKLLLEGKTSFRAYLKFADNPNNVLTDPELKVARATARAVATYSIADANELLMRLTKSKAELAKLNAESAEILANFRQKFGAQRSLVTAALYKRLKAHLALGKTEEALADYKELKAHDPQHGYTSSGGAKVAAAMRRPAYAAWKRIVGRSFKFTDPAAVAAAAKKPGFAETRARLLEASKLYRDWLFSTESAARDLKNWIAIGYYFYSIGEWADSAVIHAKALERFEGTSKLKESDADKLRLRLLVANDRLARKAQLAGDSTTAERIAHDSAALCDALMAKGKRPTVATRRIIAAFYGGYVYKDKDGFYKQVRGLGRYKEANKIWAALYEREKAKGAYGDEYWSSLFYRFLTLIQVRKKAGQTLQDVGKSLQRTKVLYPEMGGKDWAPLFVWLQRQVR